MSDVLDDPIGQVTGGVFYRLMWFAARRTPAVARYRLPGKVNRGPIFISFELEKV